MKKSRIIIPALAMIAFSMVASISGAVAWFTATRTANVTAGTYSVVKTSAGLSCTVGDGFGATASGNTATVNGVLTHGSVDHTSGKAYKASDDGTSIAAEVDLLSAQTTAANLKIGTTDTDSAQDIYAVVTFELTFKVNFGSVSSSNIGLFLDYSGSDKTRFTLPTNASALEATGFRMAFINHDALSGSAAKNTVIAPFQTSTNCKYVASTTNYNGTAYAPDTNHDLIDSTHGVTDLPTSPVASASSRLDYLGTFAYANKDSNNDVTLKFTVAAWFEGTDPNIIDRPNPIVNQDVTSYLHFAAINLAA